MHDTTFSRSSANAMRFGIALIGGHLAMWDDQKIFMAGVIDFIKDVHNGEFPSQ